MSQHISPNKSHDIFSLWLLILVMIMACKLTNVNPSVLTGEDVFRLYLILTLPQNDVRNVSVEEIQTATILTTSIYIRYLGNDTFVTTTPNQKIVHT